MRWQRPARAGVALVGLACAAALFFYSRDRERPAPVEAAPVLEDQSVSSQGSGVVNLRSNLSTGRDLRIQAERVTHYDDGRVRYENAHMTTTRADGTVFDIWAGVVEGQGKAVTGDEPGLISLSDGVRTKTSDGLELNTDAAKYDNVREFATIPGRLTFARGRLQGEGVGGTYDLPRDVLWLLDSARVARAPDEEGGGALEATATQIGLARPDRYMNMRENARIEQPDQTLAGDQLIIHFTEDERGARLIEMHGNARVTPSTRAADAPDMQAGDIALEFQEDGQTLRHATLVEGARVVQASGEGRQAIEAPHIDLVTGADGRTLTNLEARGGVEVDLPASDERPDRTIRSATLVTSGTASAGLTAAIFDGGTTFVESAPGRGAVRGERTATSATLALRLGGGLGAIETAEFRKNVSFQDGKMKAAADLAVHDQVKDTLTLTPAAGSTTAPWVDDGSVRVEAQWIEVALDTHDLHAKERIRARMAQGKSAAGGETHTPALFDATQPVYGTGAELSYVSASRSATFIGAQNVPARVYQTDVSAAGGGVKNWISASGRIEVDQETGNLHALENVESNFMLESTEGPAASGRGRGGSQSAPPARTVSPAGEAAPSAGPQATVVRAHEMTYSDAERLAVYTGTAAAVATLDGPDGSVEAEEIVLALARDERALRTLTATGRMFARFEGGREAIGDRLTYDTRTRTHVITGKPMFFKNVQNDPPQGACSLEKSTELHYEGRDQTIHEPGTDTRALRTSNQVPCSQSLKTLVPTAK